MWNPLGPGRVDSPLSRPFQLKGEFIPGFRLIDYSVGLLTTAQGLYSPRT